MPSLKSFRIVFERPDAIYKPGEIVSGNVVVELVKHKIIRALKLSAKGEAIVSWSEDVSSVDTQGISTIATLHYQGKEDYFTSSYPVLEITRDDENTHIPAGLSVYPFRIELPSNIPCSFEHDHGHIRYTIKAVIDRPWRFNHECKVAFTVIPAYDLNIRRELCVGIYDELRQDFYSLCCFGNGSIQMHVKIPSTGYVPGQFIETNINVKNTSDLTLTRISTKLERSIEFHAKRRGSLTTKKDKSILTFASNSGPFNEYTNILLSLQIPPIAPTELEFCNIINLQYILCVTLHISGLHNNICKKYPIVIGTVPLNFESQPTSETKTVPICSESDISPTASRAQLTMYDILDAPPSYKESTSKACNIKDHNDSDYVFGVNESFAPRYPVFDVPVS